MGLLMVNAHRWFDKVNGNTYYAARMVDPVTDETLAHIPYAYGYGDQYQYEILDAAIKAGKLPDMEYHPNGGRKHPPWEYYQLHGIKMIYNCTDGLKRDLKRV